MLEINWVEDSGICLVCVTNVTSRGFVRRSHYSEAAAAAASSPSAFLAFLSAMC
jgi:hypothetical protein